jgi:hypothetical protein
MKSILSEKWSIRFLYLGILLYLLSVVLYFVPHFSIDFLQEIDTQKFDSIGSFVGGMVGSIWAMAGVILFYVALMDQRQDMLINRKSLETQTEALKLQINEFNAQVEEMRQTNQIYQKQLETFEIQQFEGTFFQTLALSDKIITELVYFSSDSITGSPSRGQNAVQDYLAKLFRNIDEHCGIRPLHNPQKAMEINEILNITVSFFSEESTRLNSYFKAIRQLIEFILSKSAISHSYYLGLIKAKMGSVELSLFFYWTLQTNNFHLEMIKTEFYQRVELEKLYTPFHYDLIKPV